MQSEAVTPGVSRLVGILQDRHFETTDSGDGKMNVDAGMEFALPYPHVFIKSHESIMTTEAHRLKRILNEYGVAICPQNDHGMPAIQASYDPCDGTAVIALTGVDDSLLRR